jgi:prepilin-type N-terminal cleavage/methylation domain-containing protein
MIHPTPPGARRRAMTLVELLIALTVMAVISTAAFSILLAAANINRANSRQDSALWDADFAWHRLLANGQAALVTPAPTVTTDANGQSRLTFVVPDVTNNTTRTLIYYCTGSAAPFTLVESDPRFNVGSAPTTIASNVQSFSVTIDNSVTEQLWVDLKIAPANAFPVRRHFCIDCRNF